MENEGESVEENSTSSTMADPEPEELIKIEPQEPEQPKVNNPFIESTKNCGKVEMEKAPECDESKPISSDQSVKNYQMEIDRLRMEILEMQLKQEQQPPVNPVKEKAKPKKKKVSAKNSKSSKRRKLVVAAEEQPETVRRWPVTEDLLHRRFMMDDRRVAMEDPRRWVNTQPYSDPRLQRPDVNPMYYGGGFYETGRPSVYERAMVPAMFK